ncbi:MAG: hypothetical protein JNK87_41570, partial [Bryobacterales bacterium]|nr:hypothetical protein [Bryobacterales bacterium]
MVTAFIARLPYLAIGIVVIILFWLAGKTFARTLQRASGHTRLHDNLVTVLGRLTVATSSLIGLAVAAVVVFPTFRPGDLISG